MGYATQSSYANTRRREPTYYSQCFELCNVMHVSCYTDRTHDATVASLRLGVHAGLQSISLCLIFVFDHPFLIYISERFARRFVEY